MLRQLFKSMVVARQAAAAIETLKHMSDRQLEDIGFTRATYVDQIKTSVLAELDAADEQKVVVAPVNPNLVGAVSAVISGPNFSIKALTGISPAWSHQHLMLK